ncbi:fungal-specific transcription factor domain-containing protein [Aspergillus spinulosporus]
MAYSRSHESTPPLRRARVACKACNARRVKCDANSGQPCWHCRIRDLPCELIESRRGKYTRKRKASKRSQEPTNESPCSVAPGDSLDASNNTRSPATQPHSQSQSDSQLGHLEDSAGLTYTLEMDYTPNSGSTEKLKVHYPIPAAVGDRLAFNQGPTVKEPIYCSDPFFMPPRHVADGLIHAFFEHVHPAYPVYDRKGFMQLYLQGKTSPLVLQTIFFLGFTVGPDSLIRESGYSNRTTARKTHYLRAKALYDADHEGDPLKVVASLLLFGFWWLGPEDQKDTCYWVGCATNVAQALGMHRSSQPGMSREVRSLRKRIWWAIYTRDRHTAAAFGQPCRIRDEDCDVEPLTEDDFQFDSDYDQTLISPQRDFQVSYVIEMSKLAMILGDILVGEFSPRRPAREKYDTGTLANRLAEWESHLPDQLRRPPPHGSSEAMFWARMLYMSYHNYHVLLFRPKSIENLSPTEAERDACARTAADSITRIAEDLLATETIWPGQIHLVPALFGALSVHTIVICRKDTVRQKLAENKSRQCLLALSELSKSWPVRIWFARAFANLMRRLTGRGGSIVNVSSSIAGNRRSLAAASSPAPCIDSNAASSDILGFSELSTQPAYFSFHHAHDQQIADQLMYDSFIAGYLDSTFDPDLLLYNSLEPLLPLSVEEPSQQ